MSDPKLIQCPNCSHIFANSIPAENTIEGRILRWLKEQEFAVRTADIRANFPKQSQSSMRVHLFRLARAKLITSPQHGYWSA